MPDTEAQIDDAVTEAKHRLDQIGQRLQELHEVSPLLIEALLLLDERRDLRTFVRWHTERDARHKSNNYDAREMMPLNLSVSLDGKELAKAMAKDPCDVFDHIR